jgi:rod shape-determining protein MreD
VTVSPKIYVRLAILGAVVVIVQLAAVSQVRILGATADLTPLVVMSVGLLAGAVPGAIFGFSTGLFSDTALLQTLGVSSLLYLIIGYGSGRIRELRDPSHGLTPVALGAAATAIATIGFAFMTFLLGIDATVSVLVLKEAVLTILVNALLALPVYALVRRFLLPALPEDPRRRRRRAYTTGGLSPISRAR